MGNHAMIINCLTVKFPSLWIAQSKDTFLPQFVYNLCKLYMKTPSEEIKRFKPVEVNIYVFTILINDELIMCSSRKYTYPFQVTQFSY